MRRRRPIRKKRRDKNGTAFILFLIILIISGICLTLLPRIDTGSLKLDGLDYISGALAGAGPGTGSEKSEENRRNGESGEITRGGAVERPGDATAADVEDEAEFMGVVASKEDQKADNDSGDELAETGNESLIEKFISYAIASEFEEDSDIDGGSTGVSVVSSVVSAEKTIKESAVPVTSDIQGAVFIYHTHATESYEPYMDGNYHITSEEGSVRSVANALETGLTAKGIAVYHDKTLHDNPSYTNSYGRSLATAENYLSQHPDIRVMIDLHRDAKSSSGKKYSTINVNGAQATSFNIVVGNKNPNYQQLLSFANLVLSKANELYPGLGGRIIEREYKFNQFLSNNYMLIEVGNNGNTIDEAMLTGTLMADVLEAVMREI